MSKVFITIEDGDDGEVNFKIDFDPVIKEGESGTPAQHWAIKMLEIAKQEAGE